MKPFGKDEAPPEEAGAGSPKAAQALRAATKRDVSPGMGRVEVRVEGGSEVSNARPLEMGAALVAAPGCHSLSAALAA
jgi:hypothetical protein